MGPSARRAHRRGRDLVRRLRRSLHRHPSGLGRLGRGQAAAGSAAQGQRLSPSPASDAARRPAHRHPLRRNRQPARRCRGRPAGDDQCLEAVPRPGLRRDADHLVRSGRRHRHLFDRPAGRPVAGPAHFPRSVAGGAGARLRRPGASALGGRDRHRHHRERRRSLCRGGPAVPARRPDRSDRLLARRLHRPPRRGGDRALRPAAGRVPALRRRRGAALPDAQEPDRDVPVPEAMRHADVRIEFLGILRHGRVPRGAALGLVVPPLS